MNSKFTPLDQILINFDQALQTLRPGSRTSSRTTARPSPAKDKSDAELTDRQQKHVAGLMRINHTGEVCAQALYQGQALTARLPDVRQNMEQAASEEEDHLGWCEERLSELDKQPSLLNPLWYTMSFGLGATAGLAGDRWSLGFVAETEHQVCEHLQEHLAELDTLPEKDEKSSAILEQMLEDEARHGHQAREAGGAELPAPIRQAMGFMADTMKFLTYRL